MSEPRQHHLLPEFYLAGFTDSGTRDGLLHVFNYRRGRRYRVRPRQATRERDFYRIEIPGEDRNILEKDLSRLEGELAPTLRRVTETDVVRYEDLADLLSFASMVHVRGRRGLDRVYLGLEEKMRSRLEDGSLSRDEWERIVDAHRREGIDPSTQLAYEKARRRAADGVWSPVAPKELVLGLLPEMQRANYDALVPHVWSLAVARSDAGKFICSDSPLTWFMRMPWEHGFREDERLENQDVTVTFPLNKKLALITRPYDRGQKERYRCEATSHVVAWINSRTHLGSLGTLYSMSEDFGLLKKGNEIGRSSDYFAHIESMRRGVATRQERRQ
jgi:Protein of unknown function (DUF4238)